MRAEQSAGTVALANGNVVFRRERDKWNVALDTVCLIGEFTDESGPWGDDYCMVLVQRGTGNWYVLPYEVVGMQSLVDALSRAVGVPLTTALANSTEFQSRILWPENLRDKPFLTRSPADGLLGRMGFRSTTALLPEVDEWSKGMPA